ncbi:hypothetical protein J2X12_004121 [Pseudarthrobacter oxydans]|uniref:Mu-like prophage FluMu N-terminal domain-containing protein n=1 Tax=Pseudarthrobacter oxydans TaxID=1671 RepID=A0AAW8NIY7_PSEOX|nr:hypothetical protein [Pseudarthrobacter oxydans]MDR6794731.1 hypothetical protein [Pseudarthrobacter oxydans]MDR7166067.1 hypothetical protein [Pseudarthrobacter oxydans]
MYKVTLPREFPYNERVRAGVVINKEHGYEGELTDEQLEAIQADSLLTVEKVEAPKQAKAPSKK